MTDRITDNLIKSYLKRAIFNTGIKMQVSKESGRYFLETSDGSYEFTKRTTREQVYEFLYSLNRVLEYGNYNHHKINMLSEDELDQLYGKDQEKTVLALYNANKSPYPDEEKITDNESIRRLI